MSALKRFFVEQIGETATLTGEEFEHAKNVLRIGVGAEVILLDNSGKIMLKTFLNLHHSFPSLKMSPLRVPDKNPRPCGADILVGKRPSTE